jgi:hypothetical protein
MAEHKETGGKPLDDLLAKLVKVPKHEVDQQKRKRHRARKRRKKT